MRYYRDFGYFLLLLLILIIDIGLILLGFYSIFSNKFTIIEKSVFFLFSIFLIYITSKIIPNYTKFVDISEKEIIVGKLSGKTIRLRNIKSLSITVALGNRYWIRDYLIIKTDKEKHIIGILGFPKDMLLELKRATGVDIKLYNFDKP